MPCWAPLPSGLCLAPARFNSEEVCTCPHASVPEQFASVPWNSFNRDVLKALYGFAPISMHCNKSSAVRFQVCCPVGVLGAHTVGQVGNPQSHPQPLMGAQWQPLQLPTPLCPHQPSFRRRPV